MAWLAWFGLGRNTVTTNSQLSTSTTNWRSLIIKCFDKDCHHTSCSTSCSTITITSATQPRAQTGLLCCLVLVGSHVFLHSWTASCHWWSCCLIAGDSGPCRLPCCSVDSILTVSQSESPGSQQLWLWLECWLAGLRAVLLPTYQQQDS